MVTKGMAQVACALNGDGLTQWGEGHQWSTNGEGGAGLRESLPKINQCPQKGKKLVRSEKIRTVSKKTKHLGGETSSPSKHQKVENLFLWPLGGVVPSAKRLSLKMTWRGSQ